VLKGAETVLPRSFTETGDKPNFVVDYSDLPAAAREVGDILASCGRIFDSGGSR
jgi:hypothetical protein